MEEIDARPCGSALTGPVGPVRIVSTCPDTVSALRRAGLAAALISAAQRQAFASIDDGGAWIIKAPSPEPVQHGPQRKGRGGKLRRW